MPFISLEELIENGNVDFGDLVGDFAFQLSELLSSGVADIAQLVTAALVDAGALLPVT
jgi:hypothetical protein